MNGKKDLLGLSFGMLTVEKSLPSLKGRGLWYCVCECGGTRDVKTCDLTSGQISCCGCRFEAKRPAHRFAYNSWRGMMSRCGNPKDTHYPHYGGRGIQVCSRWESFDLFLKDMGDRPKGWSIERINTHGHYTPENCHWVPDHKQYENRTDNVLVTWQGETKLLRDWATQLGITPGGLAYRLRKWPLERAFTEPHKGYWRGRPK